MTLNLRSRQNLPALRKLISQKGTLLADVIAYKYVILDAKGMLRSPVYPEVAPQFTYAPGATLAVKSVNMNQFQACGRGVNVATKAWCRKHMNDSGLFRCVLFRVVITKGTQICVPLCSDGKFRVSLARIHEIVH